MPLWMVNLPWPLVIYIFGIGPVRYAISRNWLPWWAAWTAFLIYLPLQMVGWWMVSKNINADWFNWYLELFD